MPPAGGPAPARPSPRDITAFALSGRIAVRQGDSRYSAHLDWRHDEAHDEILVTTPLGQGVAELVRDGDGARLTLADRRQYAAADWQALSEQVFGVRLPLAGLPRWLLGDPPDAGSGWRIEILDREAAAANPLPTFIELRREDVELRLRIDDWSEVK